MCYKVKIAFWNVNGRFDFLNTTYINNWLTKNFDICFISETHLTKGQKVNVTNFNCKHNSFSNVEDPKPRGGISVLVSSNHSKFIEKIDISQPDMRVFSI